MRKLFIYSLPRSGSTLFQKYLYRNDDVSTISEPWILLPIYYIFKNKKVFSEYEQHLFLRSFNDLDMQGVNKNDLLSEIIKAASETYYRNVAPNDSKVFIDKTPRYSVICNEVIRDFKEDFHVLLFRHPLSCVSSMVKTFGNGNWCLYRFDIDLFLGLPNLIKAAKDQNMYDNLLVVKYEDFVSDPEYYYQLICSIFNLVPNNKCNLHDKQLTGSLGDPVGEKKFGTDIGNINNEYSWGKSFNTIYRRWWAKKYLQKIGEDGFLLMGYDYQKTNETISMSKYSIAQEIKDLPFILLGFIHKYTGLYVTYVKIRGLFQGKQVFGER